MPHHRRAKVKQLKENSQSSLTRWTLKKEARTIEDIKHIPK
jgi:hypothetical protein